MSDATQTFKVSEEQARALVLEALKSLGDTVVVAQDGTRTFYTFKGCTFQVSTTRPTKETVAKLCAKSPETAAAKTKAGGPFAKQTVKDTKGSRTVKVATPSVSQTNS